MTPTLHTARLSLRPLARAEARVLAQIEAGTAMGWSVVPAGTDSIIGMVGLHHIDGTAAFAQIAYEIDGEYSGKGLATEAVERVIEHARAEPGERAVFAGPQVLAHFQLSALHDVEAARLLVLLDDGLSRRDLQFLSQHGEPCRLFLRQVRRASTASGLRRRRAADPRPRRKADGDVVGGAQLLADGARVHRQQSGSQLAMREQLVQERVLLDRAHDGAL